LSRGLQRPELGLELAIELRLTRRRDPERGHDRRRPVRQPERLLRQLPHDGVPGRRNPRPTSL